MWYSSVASLLIRRVLLELEVDDRIGELLEGGVDALAEEIGASSHLLAADLEAFVGPLLARQRGDGEVPRRHEQNIHNI